MPGYTDSVHPAAAHAAWTAGDSVVCRRSLGYSLLGHCFNQCWVDALSARKQGRATHFAMLHSDIEIKSGWADRALEIMDRERCEILSVVVPIKDNTNGSSTAIDTDYWSPKRLTMSDIGKLPETFSEDDVDGELLVNTGCLLVDLRDDRVFTEENGELALKFEIRDRILVRDGRYIPQVASEDWNFSRTANRLGLRVVATTEIPLWHWGQRCWSNQPDRSDRIIEVSGGPMDGESFPMSAGRVIDGLWAYWRHGRASLHRIVKIGSSLVAEHCGKHDNAN